MSKVSPELSASARNGISRILQSLANCRQSELAEQLGVDPSTLSRMKTDRKKEIIVGIVSLVSLVILILALLFGENLISQKKHFQNIFIFSFLKKVTQKF